MMRGVSRFSVAAAMLLISASGVSAEDEGVSRRLTKYGQLRRGESESLSENVSKRMKRAADMTSAQDPLRAAVARALGVTNPNDAMSAAKIRLRLYAGLNEWALENLFAPQPGGIGRCQQEFGVTLRQCEALVAAAGRVPAEEASKLAGGAPPPMPAARPQQQMAVNRPVAQPANGSRFGKYDSGYRPAAAAAPQPAPVARPTMQPRPMAPQPMAAAPNPNAKEEYARKRAEYLERQRQEMEARKAKLVAASAGAPVERGPAADQAAPAAAPEPVAQAKAAGVKGKAAPAAEEAPAEEAPAPAAENKQALDGDLLDSLLGDPLGKK